MTGQRIEAKVAKVLSARDLALNKGENDGIAIGMRFAILNSRGAGIVDPETGEALGDVEVPKTFVKVVSLQERLSIARTFRTFATAGGSLWASLMASQVTRPAKTRTETLRTDEKRLEEELDESESYVKIGDPAVQMLGEEFFGAADE